MSEADMRRFAELAQDFYAEKQEESGRAEPIKKARASNEDGGLLIIVSCFGRHSRTLAEQTGIPWEAENINTESGSWASLLLGQGKKVNEKHRRKEIAR